uniref:Uncharacterized protein n=1 Tax=Cacopsylla melanoneura TaxID=428564 RepID=A0A8D8ZCC3_9HEMI
MIALSLYFTLLRARGFLVFLSERYSDIINNREKNLIPHFTAIPSHSIPLLSPLTFFGLLPLSLPSFPPPSSFSLPWLRSHVPTFFRSFLSISSSFSFSTSFSYFPFRTLHSFSLYYLGFSYFSLLCHLLIFLIFLSPFHSSFDLLIPQVSYFFPFIFKSFFSSYPV